MGDFDRLPNELVLLIFNKIDNLKVLCRCVVVSKTFASTIYSVDKVSLTLRRTNYYENKPRFPEPLSVEVQNLCRILTKFKELKSICVEIMCPVKFGCSTLKWRANNKSRGGNLVRSLIILSAGPGLMTEMTKHNSAVCATPTQCRDMAHLWHTQCLVMSNLLIKSHLSLKSLSIFDTHKHGKFVLEGKQLVAWRKNLLCKNFLNKSEAELIKHAIVRKLRFPGISYQGGKFEMYGFSNSKYDDPTTWEYDEEEEDVIAEAARHIFKT